MFAITRIAMGLSALATLAIATPANGRNATAQQPAQDHGFILALVDSVPRPNAIAAVVRDPAPGKTDIVVINQSAATPQVLFAILGELEASRTLDSALTRVTYKFFVSAKPVGPLPDDKLRQMSDALEQVRHRPISQIGNIGMGRWARFPDTWVRAKHRG